MRIKAVTITDFKRIKTLTLTPDPTLVIVTGRNAAGKSSALDAVEAAIGGGKSAPARPIRDGAERADVFLDLGDFTVRRKWSKDGDRLYLENPDGSRPRSPQTLLNSLFSRVAVDPFEFTRWPASKQFEVLCQVAGIAGDLADLAADGERLAEERKDVNRAVSQEEAAVRGFPTEAELAGVPDRAPSVAELMQEYEALAKAKNEYREMSRALEGNRQKVVRAGEKLEAARQRLERARAEMLAAAAGVSGAEKECESAQDGYDQIMDVLMTMEDPDLSGVMDQIGKAEELARKVRVKQERAAAVERWTQLREQAADLTSNIEMIRGERAARLATAKFPVIGLTVTGDEVRVDGVPLDQASSAQKILLGLAVASALNPTLRVAIVRDGSLLDDDSLDVAADWAALNDWQLWVEKVGGPDSPEGVVIEDGLVVADRPARKPKKAAAVAAAADPEPHPPAGFTETRRQAEELF